MRLLLPAVLALAGCATTPDRLGWTCVGQASSADIQASSLRDLDRNASFRRGTAEWVRRPPPSEPLEVRAAWELGNDIVEGARASVRFRTSRAMVPGEVRRLEISGTQGILATSGWSPGPLHEISLRGADLQPVAAGGRPLAVRLVTRAGGTLFDLPVDPALFTRGLDLVRQADGASLAASADYMRLCERKQRIIPT